MEGSWEGGRVGNEVLGKWRCCGGDEKVERGSVRKISSMCTGSHLCQTGVPQNATDVSL
ncbi:hypothetical protein HAX54_047153, partial [Datura stramonium]|nr:hypothetical protein [Datura stramonium]